MSKGFVSRGFKIAVVLAVLVCVVGVQADDEPTGWTDTAEFGIVATDGLESTSFGFKNVLAREWDKSLLTFRAGGVRVKTTTTNLSAIEGVITKEENEETSAENYYFNGRYDRKITERLFWFAGAGWDRNRPSGIENRYIAEAGVGNIWRDTDDLKFKTNYGLTFTDQENVFDPPGSDVDDSFLGARFAWDYMNKLGANATYTNVLVLDENLDETSDWRADMTNGLAVAMSEKMALKVGLQLLYDNEPSFEEVSNVDLAGDPLLPVGYELDELDTILTISLVVDFM